MTNWVAVKDKLPDKEGKYLVYKQLFATYFSYDIESFSFNLESVDKNDFRDRKYPGFYFCDYRYGYIEDTDAVKYWSELPEPPF